MLHLRSIIRSRRTRIPEHRIRRDFFGAGDGLLKIGVAFLGTSEGIGWVAILIEPLWLLLRCLHNGQPRIAVLVSCLEDDIDFFERSSASLRVKEVDGRNYGEVEAAKDNVGLPGLLGEEHWRN